WEGWAILLRQKQKKLIMLPSETMIWQPEFTDKTLSRKIGAVHFEGTQPGLCDLINRQKEKITNRTERCRS
ncbi:hypothetical protein, partial [Escherichia coli]|uniref:hypothetical protein n=1 Tax=Escherichia coli TaxID=562 RepID=UPI001BE4A558